MVNISVCIPSYKRPYVKTLEYIPYAKVYVDEKEYSDYVDQNPEGSNIVSVPEGIQGNVSRIRNYILDTEFEEEGADIVCIVDDDMSGIYYWENNKSYLLDINKLKAFLYKYSVMAKDMGVKMWGININKDKQMYRENAPFSFLSFVGGPFQVFIDNAGGLRYDVNLPLKEDYDMTVQQLNKYRRVLRVNKYYYDVKQSVQSGGCAEYRNIKREEQQLFAFQKKWGSRIVKVDKSVSTNFSMDKKAHLDYNPIIKVPIKGI